MATEEALDFSLKSSSLQIRSVSLPTVPAQEDYGSSNCTPFKQERIQEMIKSANHSPTSTTETENGTTGSGDSMCDTYFQSQAADLLRRALTDPMFMAGQTWPPNLLGTCSPFVPDQAMLPTTSLAISSLNRRKRKNSVAGSSDNEGSESNSSPIKAAKPQTPGNGKDDSYWERRRKNNLAAKRSRDARREKEDEIAFRAAVLEQENVKLKAQVNVLKNEMSRLHYILFNQTKQ